MPQRAGRRAVIRTILPKLIVLPTSRIDKGTQGDRRHCLCGVLSLTKGWEQGGIIMQQKLYWLDYDPVVAVLVIGMGMVGLLALFM